MDLPSRSFESVAIDILIQTKSPDDPGNKRDDKAQNTDIRRQS